jgi:hypothetical protein
MYCLSIADCDDTDIEFIRKLTSILFIYVPLDLLEKCKDVSDLYAAGASL